MTGHSDGVSTAEHHRDERHGFSLAVPEGWRVQRGVAGLLVAIVRDDPGGGFRPSLNVVRKMGIRTIDLDDLAETALRELTRLLTDLTVVDVEATVVSGTPARRVLFSYRQGTFGLTAEQWLFYAGEGQWTISAAASSDRYDAVADVFAGIVASLEIAGG